MQKATNCESSNILRDSFSSNFSRQSLSNEALGNRHSALRCGIQCMQLALFCAFLAFSGFRIGVRNDDYRVPHLKAIGLHK